MTKKLESAPPAEPGRNEFDRSAAVGQVPGLFGRGRIGPARFGPGRFGLDVVTDTLISASFAASVTLIAVPATPVAR